MGNDKGAGTGPAIGHTVTGDNVTIANRSAKNPVVEPTKAVSYAPVAVTLDANGKIDYAATPGALYIITPNAGAASQSFTGFLNMAAVPARARIIIQAAAGKTINLSSNAGVVLRSNVSVALTGNSEAAFEKRDSTTQIYEVGRVYAASQTVPATVTSSTLTASATYDQAQMQTVLDRLKAVSDLANNLRTAVTQGGLGNN